MFEQIVDFGLFHNVIKSRDLCILTMNAIVIHYVVTSENATHEGAIREKKKKIRGIASDGGTTTR